MIKIYKITLIVCVVMLVIGCIGANAETAGISCIPDSQLGLHNIVND